MLLLILLLSKWGLLSTNPIAVCVGLVPVCMNAGIITVLCQRQLRSNGNASHYRMVLGWKPPSPCKKQGKFKKQEKISALNFHFQNACSQLCFEEIRKPSELKPETSKPIKKHCDRCQTHPPSSPRPQMSSISGPFATPPVRSESAKIPPQCPCFAAPRKHAQKSWKPKQRPTGVRSYESFDVLIQQMVEFHSHMLREKTPIFSHFLHFLLAQKWPHLTHLSSKCSHPMEHMGSVKSDYESILQYFQDLFGRPPIVVTVDASDTWRKTHANQNQLSFVDVSKCNLHFPGPAKTKINDPKWDFFFARKRIFVRSQICILRPMISQNCWNSSQLFCLLNEWSKRNLKKWTEWTPTERKVASHFYPE